MPVKKYTIEFIKIFAETKESECLSNYYEKYSKKLKWKCKLGHIWEASWASIKANHWCPYCTNRVKDTIEHMQELAKNKNGRCLSSEYINWKTQLKWECHNKHTWYTAPSVIKNGSWCPYCKNHTSELKCRFIIEKLTNHNFPEKRIAGSQLRLDGFCSYLSIAFEHNGRQHYEFIDYFHKTKDDFLRQIERDQLKYKLCKEQKIKILIIPYYVSTNDQKLVNFISDFLIKHNIKIIQDSKIMSEFYENNNKIKELKKIAESKNGSLLSQFYYNTKTKLEWKCHKNHTWFARPTNVKSGIWCPFCSKNTRLTIEEMKQIAKNKGGECLSNTYINAKTNLIWKCKEEHVWKASPDHVKHGTWCPVCGRKYERHKKQK